MITETSLPSPVATAPKTSVSAVLRSRPLARLLSPVLAILPWWITVMGVARMGAWQRPMNGESTAGLVMTAMAVLLVAAVLWAAVAVLSATGPLLAGACTLVLAMALSTSRGQYVLATSPFVREVDVMMTVSHLSLPVHSLIAGSLLVTLGLAVALARRLPR